MSAPHEIPPTGASAALAARLAGGVPVLDTPRTRLRPLRIEDFPAWAEILCSDRASHMDGPCTRDDAFTEFAASAGGWLLRGHGCWTVADRATDEPLGFICLNMEPGDREPELGFFVRAAAEGRGLAAEAAEAARDWAWAQGLGSLVSYVSPDNERSCALARRLGAERDAAAEAEGAADWDEGTQVWRHPRPVREGVPAPDRPDPAAGVARPALPPGGDARAAALLGEHRESIDRLDAILVWTLAERFKHTQAVGRLKAAHGLPPSDPAREASQVARLKRLAAEADLDPEFAQKVLAFIIQEVIKHHERHHA